jgi:UDPglucose--hexose-1-phosphate uridylyltransferase
VPDEPLAETYAQRDYLEKHGTHLLSDYRDQELKLGERVVCENDAFVAVVPFWAVWPFETLLLAKESVGSFTDLSAAQVAGLADILKRVTTRYDNLFHVSFPYTMGFHQRPTEVKKFMVGFEMLGMPQRDITPEKAAEMLRACSEEQA